MQQVINANERNQAFWQYLLMFLITTGLIITASFFNIKKVPDEVVTSLREEVDKQKKEAMQQEEFMLKINEAKGLLDSFNRVGNNTNSVEVKLTQKINELYSLQTKDSSLYSTTNKAIVYMFIEIHRLKRDINELDKKAARAGEINSELLRTKEDLRVTQGELKEAKNELQYRLSE